MSITYGNASAIRSQTEILPPNAQQLKAHQIEWYAGLLKTATGPRKHFLRSQLKNLQK